MRTIFGKISVLVLASGLAGSAIVAGCSSTPDNKTLGADQGSVGFQLDVGGGATINTMHVIVYGNGLGALGASTNIVKDLDVSAITGSVATFSLTLPKGLNYQVALSTPENATCAGTATFSVLAAQTSTIGVTMSCASTDVTGGTDVNATACTPRSSTPCSSARTPRLLATSSDSTLLSRPARPSNGLARALAPAPSVAARRPRPASPARVRARSRSNSAWRKNGCSTSKSYSVTCTGGSTGSGGATGAGGASAGGASAGGAPAGGAPAGGAPAGGAPAGGAPSAGAPAGGAPAGGAPAGGAPAGGAPSGGGTGAPTCPGPVDNENGTGQVCSAAFAIDECGTNCAQIDD